MKGVFEMAVHFYYVRHGETRFNVLDRVQGVCDSPLTERGIEQARACAERMRYVPLTRAFSSSSERAYDTAVLVLGERELPVTRLKDLREFDFGSYEGFRMNVPSDELTDLQKCWDERDYTRVGGENREHMVARVRRAFETMLESSKDEEHVLVVSHRGYFLYVLEALFGYTLEQQEADYEDPMELVPNASVACFSYDGEWKLEQLPQA